MAGDGEYAAAGVEGLKVGAECTMGGQSECAARRAAAALAAICVQELRGRARVTRYPISIWRMTISILSSHIPLAHIPYPISRMTISIW